MVLATAAAIRDQLHTLLEALTPTTDAVEFRRYRNEGDGDFRAWVERNPAAAFRRFQVREVSADEEVFSSSTTQEHVRIRYEILVAYPQSHRYGAANAMDRDDVMNQDWKLINKAIGLYGRANLTTATVGSYDAIPLGATRAFERGAVVDLLVVSAEYEYLRSIA